MKKHINKFFFWCLPLLGMFFLSSVEAVFLKIENTEAGETANIRMSDLLSGEQVGFTVLRPQKASIKFSEKADTLGVLSSSIYGLHLRESGQYQLRAVREFSSEEVLAQAFAVLPGEVSAYRSKIISEIKSVPADGSSESHFKVLVRDAYDNPIPNKTVKVLSSRNGDVVVADGKTDNDGIARGKIVSKTPGVSVLSALIENTVVFEKLEIIFHLPQNLLGNVGASDSASGGIGQFLKAQIFQETFGQVSYFTIEELPAEAITERNYTIKVTAKDEDGNIVKNYAGKVRFSSSDNQAQLPADYQFEPEDQGTHNFALAATFGSPGEHTINVNDLSNFEIKGQKNVQVFDKDHGTAGEDQALTIITPLEGTYSATRMSVTGKGPAGTTIKLTDGPTLLIEDLMIDSNGDFVYQTPSLADGVHKFRAALLDESIFSNEVIVRIDQTPPRVLTVEVDPPEVEPGAVFNVKVASNEPLATTSCVFNQLSQTFKESGDFFIGNYQAPQKCGEYPIGCTASDLLGNELHEENAATVKVCTATTDPSKDTDGDEIPDRVEGYELDDDGDCVKNWLESNKKDSIGKGIDDQANPTNDSDGDLLSNIAECTQCKTDPMNPKDNQCLVDGEPVEAPIPVGSDTPGVVPSNENIRPTSILNLTAIPGDKKVDLYWSPAKDDNKIVKYQIQYGKIKGKLVNTNETPDDRTRWYVEGLEEGTKYYFQVSARDDKGNTGTPSNVIEATTNGDVLHSSAVPKSGAQEWLPFVLAFLGGIFFLFLSRKRSL